jgi:NAD(P)H-hydrate epimerase
VLENIDPAKLPKLSPRNGRAHKGDFGHVLVIGGSINMPGASILAAHTALRAGAGLVTLCPGSSERDATLWPEIMTLIQKTSSYSFHGRRSLKIISEFLIRIKPTLLVGPGLGHGEEIGELIHEIIKASQELGLFGVLDADALNAIAEFDISGDFSGFVVTPHPGEAARLLRCEVEDIQNDRPRAAAEISQRLPGAVVVLKGAGTIILRDGKAIINTSGNPYLATAGSGDILAGLITGLIAQDATPMEAALLGVYIHGISADKIVKRRFGPLVASDLLQEIPVEVGLFTDR